MCCRNAFLHPNLPRRGHHRTDSREPHRKFVGKKIERSSETLPNWKGSPWASLHPVTSTLTIFQTYCGNEGECIGTDNCSECPPTGSNCSGGITQIVCGMYSLCPPMPNSISLCCFQRLALKYDLGPSHISNAWKSSWNLNAKFYKILQQVVIWTFYEYLSDISWRASNKK